MAKVVFHRAYNFADIDLSEFLAGDVTSFSNSQIVIVEGNYAATLGGAFVPGPPPTFAPPSGTIQTIDVAFKGGPLFSATDVNVDLGQVYANLNNDAVLLEMFFGGADSFKGSRGADHMAGWDGADGLNGAKGGDFLTGGADADILTGGAGGDTFIYLAVSDSMKKTSDVILDLEAGDFIDAQMLDVQGDVTSAYNARKDLTVFSVDADGDGRGDLFISAKGDHVGFEDSGHFLI